nr:4-hydroxy-tetrahydrodipicolinate reductase [Kofleriaceae bacterium]
MKICVLGPSGRMGRAVIEAVGAARGATLVAAVDRPGAADLGATVAPGIVATTDLQAGLDACDVYIDFTSPDATVAAAKAALAAKKPAVIGTTGTIDDGVLSELALVAPIVVAANFSLGVNVVLGVAKQVARALGDWDAEIVETHHRAKRDAPSGTALMIARAIAAGRGVDYDAVKRHARDGDVGPRPDGEIGVVAVRGGDVVGEHVASFFGHHERVEIAHRATSRAIFAQGAVRAALWLAGKVPGRYSMLDVLGLQ